jgi:bacterial surface protein 26-residue repeat
MFCNCVYLSSLDVSKLNTSKVTTMKSMFGGCECVVDMQGMFSQCQSLVSIVEINTVSGS